MSTYEVCNLRKYEECIKLDLNITNTEIIEEELKKY